MAFQLKPFLLGLAVALSGQSVSAQTFEEHYASVRGWDVVSLHDQGQFVGCGMSRPDDGGFDFALYYGFGDWEILVPTSARAQSDVTIDMDLDRMSEVVIGKSDGMIASALVAASWVNAIANGRTLTVYLEGWTHEIPLTGTTAAILKVEECVGGGGQQPRTSARASTSSSTSSRPSIVQQPVESDAARMGVNCPAYGAFRSPDSQDWGDVEFVNYVDHAVTIYWIDLNGHNVEMASLLPGQNIKISSNAGHHFIIKDFDATCFGGVWTLGLGENYIEIRG